MTGTRVLLFGYGVFGRVHAAAWRQCGVDELIVVEPHEFSRARATREGLVDAAIPEATTGAWNRTQIADIVTPPATHLTLVLEALERGKAVLLEKPAVLDSAEASRLWDAWSRVRVPLQVNMVLRTHPLLKAARQKIHSGAIGRILYLEACSRGWKRMRADSGLIENDGIHMLDLIAHLSGTEIQSIQGTGYRLLGGTSLDTVTASMRLANGILADIRLGVVGAGGVEDPFLPGAVTEKYVNVMGDKGTLGIDFNRHQLTHSSVLYRQEGGEWWPAVQEIETKTVIGCSATNLVAESCRNLRDALDGSAEVLCGVADGVVMNTRCIEQWKTSTLQSGLES